MTSESMSRAADESLRSDESPRLHASIALAPYVETLVVGRRVAVLGDSTLGLADSLVSRGARLVHAYDPDPTRVAESIAKKAPAFGSAAAGRPAARGVVYAMLGDDLGVRDGAFDAVLIPDLTIFTDKTDAVRRAKKLCSPSGAVVVASPNPDAKRRLLGNLKNAAQAPGYYELYDLLTLQFPIVRMLGQAPFLGYAIVAFAPDREPDVSFDASLLAGTEEPEMFVAVASERNVSTDPYMVVEVPSEDVLDVYTSHETPSIAPDPNSTREDRFGSAPVVQLAEAKARMVLMEAELEDLRSQKTSLLQSVEGARSEEAQNAAERLRELEARAGDEHVRAERLTHKVRDLEDELVRQRDRAQKLSKALDDEKKVRQKAEIELGMARGLTRNEESPAPSAKSDALSNELRETASRADALAHELLAKSKETAEIRRELEAANEALTTLEQAHKALTDQANAAEKEVAALRLQTAAEEQARRAAETKNAETLAALHIAQAKLADLEEDQVQTLRRPQAPSVPVVVPTEMDARVATQIARLSAEASVKERAAEEMRRELENERALRRDLASAKVALEVEAATLRRRIDMLERDAEAAPELTELESRLVERGRHIAKLQSDLRESERIGRELISVVEELRGAADHGGSSGGTSSSPGGSSPMNGSGAPQMSVAPATTSAMDVLSADAFQHRIDALAADAAQKQAELLSTTWRIQALERELSDAKKRVSDPSAAERELANALMVAQSEIANLRRTLGQGPEGTGITRGTVEDAVLKHQQLGG
ncbi:MAG: hypothetical protein IPK82_14905 [Polyangiaceae bacterium]|nr:hypothetical protein [Polyangiaceae bacterium]